MAGFGFSISDIVTVCDFAWTVYKSSKHAGEEFRAITDDVKSLQASLHELNDEVGNPISLVHRSSPTQKKELKALMRSCTSDLQELEKLLANYRSLKSSAPRKRDRLRFTPDKQAEMRVKISTHSDRLTRFLNQLHTSALGRIELNGERNTLTLDEMKAKLNAIHQDVLAGKKDASLLTDMDDWGTLEKELLDDNITEVDVELNKDTIIDWLGQIRSGSGIQHERSTRSEVDLGDEKVSSAEPMRLPGKDAESRPDMSRYEQPKVEDCLEDDDEIPTAKISKGTEQELRDTFPEQQGPESSSSVEAKNSSANDDLRPSRLHTPVNANKSHGRRSPVDRSESSHRPSSRNAHPVRTNIPEAALGRSTSVEALNSGDISTRLEPASGVDHLGSASDVEDDKASSADDDSDDDASSDSSDDSVVTATRLPSNSKTTVRSDKMATREPSGNPSEASGSPSNLRDVPKDGSRTFHFSTGSGKGGFNFSNPENIFAEFLRGSGNMKEDDSSGIGRSANSHDDDDSNSPPRKGGSRRPSPRPSSSRFNRTPRHKTPRRRDADKSDYADGYPAYADDYPAYADDYPAYSDGYPAAPDPYRRSPHPSFNPDNPFVPSENRRPHDYYRQHHGYAPHYSTPPPGYMPYDNTRDVPSPFPPGQDNTKSGSGFHFSNPESIFAEFLRGAEDHYGSSKSGTTSKPSTPLGTRGGREPRPSGSRTPEIAVTEKPLIASLEELFSGATKKFKVKRKLHNERTGRETLQDRILEVPIKKGLKPGSKIKFFGVGDHGGDLHFILECEPHHYFTRDGHHLHHSVEISLKESLCGWKRTIQTIDGRSLPISSYIPTGPDWTDRFPGLGMPISKKPSERGDLIVGVKIQYPSKLSDSQKTILADVL